MSLAVSQPPQALLRPINVPSKLLMGPGPSSCSPRVLAAGSLPLLGHLHPEFVQIMDECKDGIRYFFQTRNRLTLAVSGSGHAAMEMACDNMVEQGDTVLIITSGVWGGRFAEMVRRHGGHPIELKRPGKPFQKEEIETALSKHKPKLLFVTHGESSSALLQPIVNLGHLCHRYDCLLVVDAVASAGGVPLFMDEWGIDVLYTGGQKCLSAPPGASPISFSERAYSRYMKRKHKPVSYYLDLTELANYWGCDGAPSRRYHHTGLISCVYALREALALLAEEGLETMWKRHAECSQQLCAGLQAMGLQLYMDNPEHRLPTVTGVRVPAGVDCKSLTAFLMKTYKLEVSGGLGHTAGQIWRIGVMGHNARPHIVDQTLRAVREALQQQGYSKSKL